MTSTDGREAHEALQAGHPDSRQERMDEKANWQRDRAIYSRRMRIWGFEANQGFPPQISQAFDVSHYTHLKVEGGRYPGLSKGLDPGDRSKSISYGIKDYVTKPFKFSSLLTLVQACLE